MSTVKIYGVPPSSYVRTARMTCVEKGIDHEFEPVDFKSESHFKLHPFGKVPILKHGDVHLYETTAIAHYINDAFDGPNLVPTDAAKRGDMEQWISVLNCYAYDDLVKQYLLPFIGNKLDEAALNDHLPNIERDLKLVDTALTGKEWLAGEFSLADLFWGAAVSPLPQLPHTGKILENCGNFRAWLDRLTKRKSVEYLFPPK